MSGFVAKALVGISMVALTSGKVSAQAAPAATPDAAAAQSPADVGIADVIVTAQRRSERLQSVPVAVTALTAQALDRAGIAQTSDLQVVTPGLVYSTAISVPTPFIRGVGSRDNTAANESGVATYLDGIYYAGMPAGLLALPNIERIEVLKGPQGTLFGRNANGGLIQIITRDPPREFSGTVKLSYANYDTITASGYLGGPVTNALRADLSVYYTDQHDGWGRNLVSGVQINLAKDIALRGKALWEPAAGTRVVLAADYDHRRSDIGSAVNILAGTFAADGRCGGSFPAGYSACAPRPASTMRGTIYDSQSDLYGINGKNGAQKAGTEQGGVSLTAEHDVGGAVLRSLSSYRRLHTDQYIDQDGSSLPISSVILRQDDRTFTQELQAASPASSAFKWIVGGFYMHRRAGYDPFQPFGYSLGLPSPLDPAGQYGAPPRFGGGFSTFAQVTINSYSGYGQATLEVLPSLNLTGGIRYTSDVEHLVASQVDARGVQRASADVRQTFSKVTYRLSLDRHFGQRVMAYASYNRGFKAGLFNTTSATGTFAGPETLDAYEVGLKSDLLDRRLRLNLAAFHYRYDGLQLAVVVPGGTQTINAAKANINGLDVESQLQPVRHLTLSAGGSFLFDAKYLSFPGGPLFTPSATGNTQVAADLSGRRIIRSPKFSGNIGADYTFDIGSGEIGINSTLYHNSGFYWTPDDVFRQKSYNLLNAQLSWTSPNKKLSLRLWGRNILGTRYLNLLAPTTLGTVTAPAEPRTYGLTSEVKF